ncbi:MAG: hypothetical protein M3082_06525 [Candidatus Dormibacteraeota bacterium]|nr:hypothetical protein [Candidatus Dormibacteraeota bacterium]
MDHGTLLVLADGEPNDPALVRTAREYADAKGCSVTLLRVLPETTRALRTDRGTHILPWQVMQMREADAKLELERLRGRFLRGRFLSNTMLVRVGNLMQVLQSTVEAHQATAVLARSRRDAFFPWLMRDRRLKASLGVPVLFLDTTDKLVGDLSKQPSELSCRQSADGVNCAQTAWGAASTEVSRSHKASDIIAAAL